MIVIILLMQRFFLLSAYYIIGMNEDSQIQTYPLDLNIQNYGIDSYFAYGLWSRYSPLGSILQVGQFGVLDSHCFHLHNAAQQSTFDLNLIVYDCLNYETQTIFRRIQFLTVDENWHFFEVQLDNFKYEYIWHYFQITQWPQRNRFELLVIEYPETKLNIVQEDFQFPYKDTQLLLTFGGGLQISQSNTNQVLQQISKFSYFPGKFYLYPLSTGTMSITRNTALIALDGISLRVNCLCSYNGLIGIPDKELTWLDKIIFPSQNSNCKSYMLSTWIRIKNIYQSSPVFLYQVLKLAANFENPKLVNSNLATFQLFYKITPSKNQLIVTTYSYTFPIVSINFEGDPFLITKALDLQHNIQLWQYVLVILKDNKLQIQVIFYEGFQLYEYSYELTVNQFNIVKFKLEYGNVQQQAYDYLSVQFLNSYFFNCVGFIILPQLYCHQSCLECDGPTSTDCLSCPSNSIRIYIAEQKSCVCPYNTVDDSDCKDYQNYNFVLVKEDVKDLKCLEGYFQYEGNCIKCPSSISSTSITCLECVYQPQTWATNSFCQTTLYNDIQGSVSQLKQTKSQQYYIFDGDELESRYYINSKIIDEEIKDDFELTSMNFRSFCFQAQTIVVVWRSEKECYQCALKNCKICIITEQKSVCLACDYYTELKDGICISTSQIGQINFNNCLSPNYTTSTYQCKLCNIKYCKYCFEFLSNDLTKCTLYKNFEQFNIDEYHQVGCALCDDNFIYDFISGKCKYEKPKIDKCLRSYINLQGQEICTLSKVDDFNIAPEIINCQSYIQNCRQCLMTPQKVIRCILCEDGYTTSITTGLCYKCSINNARICIEGDYQLNDQWVQVIQSFLIQFLPNQYMYPKSDSQRSIIELTYECSQGFKPDPQSKCIKYCDSNCLSCVLTETYPYQFYCNECPLDYYQIPLRSSENGKCIQCPQLCSVCQSRTDEEIKMINPYYVVNDDTILYTFKCLQKAQDDNIVIDPYTNIAKYCYQSICTDIIQYQLDIDCFNLYNDLLDKQSQVFYQNNININYCNKLGIQKIILNMRIIIKSGILCRQSEQLEIYNDLRQRIYTLQEVQLIMEGLERIGFYLPITIINFSTVEIINMNFEVKKVSYLKLENNSSQINLIIKNSMIFGDLSEIQQYSMNLSKCGDLIIQNLQIINLNLMNSSLFDYISINPKSKISIQNLQIYGSIFNNTVLFTFSNLSQNIQITNISIISCKFYNSPIFQFTSISQKIKILVDINGVELQKNIFINSNLIAPSNEIQINLNDMKLYQNQFTNLTLLDLSQNLVLYTILISDNTFIQSLFLFITEIEGQYNTILIDNINFVSNSFEASSIMNTKLYNNNAFTTLQITNFFMNDNQKQFDSGLHLFNLNCYSLIIRNCYFTNSINLNHFQLFEIQSIIIENIVYLNKQQNYKVPLSFECIDQKEQNPQLFYISGFSKLLIQKIKIKNQFSIDYSLIHILSNILYSPNNKEVIEIRDVIFEGNILLKQSLGIIFSQISIYSEKFQEISLQNIIFQEGFFNEQIDDPSQNSAGLIFLNSQQSSVTINNLTCQSNAVTNSSNSFIYINSNSVQIDNITIKNHNSLNSTIWNKYYEIPLQNQNNSDQTHYIVQSLFKFQNKGGIISITSSNIIITLGVLTEIQSQSSSIFDIRTQGQGVVHFVQLSISQTEVELQSSTEAQGCISIYSKNSLLNLKIQYVKFKNIFNRLSSSVLSITPSQKFNNIEIQDVILESCLSLTNQFMKIEFSQFDQNLVSLQNLSIYQSDSDWIEYFNKIDPISLSEINKIPIDNAIINLIGCQLIIQGLISEGTLISPILKISDSQKIQIKDCKINSIQTFFTFSILQFIQTKTQKSSIFLEKFLLRNITLFQKSNEQVIAQKTSQNKYTANKCTIDISAPITQVTSTFSFQQILEYLNQNISSTGSLISIQSISSDNVINLRNFIISSNKFSEKLNGLINFNLLGFQELRITEVICFQNQINEFGCLTFIASKSLDKNIRLINSKFLFNNGTFGSAIYAKKVIIVIKNSQFIENIAQQDGGAIYMENCSNYFRIINSFILKNQAQQGGGIFFNGNNYINKDTVINSLILLNSAEKLTDNIVELPHHLTLSINYNKMFSSQEISENLTTNILKLNSYNIIEQGQLINTSQLYLPSNQAIADFILFNPKNQGYLSYIQEFSLFFQNSFNEKVSNLNNFTCKAQMFTQTQNNQSFENGKPIETLPYNQEKNTVNLEQLTFTFDPYQNTDQVLLVQINCSTQQNQTILRYIFRAKTFKCQLGEFYVNNGCQVCQQSQGFYSVTYDTTKCSIFDKTKFSNITSNRIQLLKGFWRPHEKSDYTELCFKQQAYCLGGWDVGNNLCFRGHIGGLCEECDNYNIRGEGQFFKDFENQTCQLCSKSSRSIFIFIAASLWSIFQILLTLKSIDKSNQLFYSLKLRKKVSKILFKLNQGINCILLDHQSIQIKMFINFLWIFSLIFSFNISFSFSFGFVDQISNPSNFMATSLDCYLLEFQQIQLNYSRIMATLLLIILQLILMFVGSQILALTTKFKNLNSVLSNTGLYLYVSNFAALIKQFSSLLSRRQISNVDYIQGNVSLLFDTQSHYAWIYRFIIPGLGFVGCFIPVILFFIMFIMRKKLDMIKFRKHICYMFNEYAEHCYYWEFIKIWKKTILIIILTYFETNILLKASLLGLTLLLYQFCAGKIKPFINQKLNSLDLETGQFCSIAIFLAATIYVCEQTQNQNYSYLLQSSIILLLIKLSYPFIYQIISLNYKMQKMNVLTLLLKCSNLLMSNSTLAKHLNYKLIELKQREQKLKSNIQKLKQYLFSVSKIINENQKLLSSQQQFQNKSTFRILTSRETEVIKFMKSDHE